MRCGYALDSLPPDGACPECGVHYDQRTIVLPGMWAGDGGIATGSRGAVITAVVAQCILMIALWRPHQRENHALAIALTALCVVSLFVEFAFRRSAHRVAPRGSLLQCRFNRFGCLQCDVPEETTGARDPRQIFRGVTWGALAILAIAWVVTHSLSWPWVAPVIAIVFWAGRAQWRRGRALQFASQDVDARVLMTAARCWGRQVPAIPWSAIAEIHVGQFRGNPNRWYLTSKPSKPGSKRGRAIDAEVEATAVQILELQARIARWQADAARPNA